MAHPGFVVEFNNPTAYGKQFGSHLGALGIKSKRLSHKTAWHLNYDGSFSTFKDLKRKISKSVKIGGSALIVSLRYSKAWVLKKNRAGKFQIKKVIG